MFKNRSFRFLKMLKHSKGFTFVEVAVTLAILAILMAIAIPSYISWLPKHRLLTGVRQIYDDLNLAKIRAIQANTLAVAKFDIANNRYTIFLENPALPINWALDASDTIIKQQVTFEKDVRLTGTTLPAHTCGFNNRGMLPAGAGTGVIRLTNPANTLMGVEVLNTAGNIRIVTSTDGWATWN